MDWLKWNTNASRIMAANQTTIGMVYMDNTEYIIGSLGKKIEDVSVFTPKIVAIREALRTARDCNMDKIII